MRTLLSGLALMTCCALTPAMAAAEDGVFDFRLAAHTDTAQQKVNADIEASLQPYSFVFRGFAQGKLEEYNKVCRRITFTLKGEELGYACVHKDGESHRETSPADGSYHARQGADGKRVDLKQTLKTKKDHVVITQHWKGEQGMRVNTFVYNPSTRKLTMKVRLKSPQLDRGDITYMLHYTQK